ncbi:unnamed protein product [Schistosoma bovis]|nr:unnamed protein product [Schistosoma haematobium]CAH8438468.1 unnamed protein product [Schistosoma haematobium]CAH8486033.1 unnamed protein product [Schistosoma bovis]
MNFFTLYVTLVYTILSVHSNIEPLIEKVNYYNLGKYNSQVTHKSINRNSDKMPEYDDQLPDFPHKQLEEEESPFHRFSELLNSGSVLPLWLVNPMYYVFEVFARTVSYYIN